MRSHVNNKIKVKIKINKIKIQNNKIRLRKRRERLEFITFLTPTNILPCLGPRLIIKPQNLWHECAHHII